MPDALAEPLRRRSAVSLLELIVVLAIIAILATLLLVAVQYSREAARRTVCQNNLRQLSFAMRSYVETRKQYPALSPPDEAGGWVLELLPFLEEQSLQDEFKARPALVGANGSSLARKRLSLFTCPNGFDGDSSIEGIPAAHYLLELPSPKEVANRKRRRWWQFFDAPLENRLPWVAGPEDQIHYNIDRDRTPLTGPHSGGFHQISTSDESCTLWYPREWSWSTKK